MQVCVSTLPAFLPWCAPEVALAQARHILQELPGSIVLGYLKIDAQPMKQALGTTVSKFMHSFTTHIQSRVFPFMQQIWTFLLINIVGNTCVRLHYWQ